MSVKQPPTARHEGSQVAAPPGDRKASTPATNPPAKQSDNGKPDKKALKQLQKTLQGGLNEACRNGDVHQIRIAYESWLHHEKVLSRPTCLFAQTMQGVLQAIGNRYDVYEAVAFIEEVFTKSKEHVQTTESLLFLLLRSFVVRGEVLAHNHGEAKGVGEEDDENVSAKSALLEKALAHFHEAGKTLNKTALKLRTCLPLLELTALFGRSDKAEEFYANQVVPRWSTPGSGITSGVDDSKNAAPTASTATAPSPLTWSSTTTGGPNVASLIMGSSTRNSQIQLNDDQRNWELVFVYRLKAALASRRPGEGKSAKDLVEAIVGQLASTCPRLALTEADAEKEVQNPASTWAVLRTLLAAHYEVAETKISARGLCTTTRARLGHAWRPSEQDLQDLLSLITRLATELRPRVGGQMNSKVVPSHSRGGQSGTMVPRGADEEDQVEAPSVGTSPRRHDELRSNNETPEARRARMRRRWEAFRERLESEVLWRHSNAPYDCVLDGANIGHCNQNFATGAFSLAQIDAVVTTLRKLGRKPLIVLRERWLVAKGEDLRKHLDKEAAKRKRRKLAPLDPKPTGNDEREGPEATTSEPRLDNSPKAAAVEGESSPAPSDDDDDDEPACVDPSRWHPIARKWAESGTIFVSPHRLNDDWVFLYVAVRLCIEQMSKKNSTEATPLWLVSNDLMRDHLYRMGHHPVLLRWRDQHLCKFFINRMEMEILEEAMLAEAEGKEDACGGRKIRKQEDAPDDDLDEASTAVQLYSPQVFSSEAQKIGGTWFLPFVPASQVTSSSGSSVAASGTAGSEQGGSKSAPAQNKVWRWMTLAPKVAGPAQ